MSCKANKNTCRWFRSDKNACGVLNQLVCDRRRKCSFYETAEDFQKRQIDFNERHGITEDMRIL